MIRYLLRRKGNTCLVLDPPRYGPRYWYIYLFGDPCERVTKKLWIRTRLAGSEKSTVHTFLEDEHVEMRLRAVCDPAKD